MPSRPINPEAVAIVENRRREISAALAELVIEHPVITLELGCGHGHFLTEYAGKHPGQYCVGIDQQANRIGRSFRKRDRSGFGNLCFLRAEGRQFLTCLPEEMRLARIFVLFPDPWPKRRHIKNRMLGPSMLANLARRARPDAELFLRTDDFNYLDWVEANMEASAEWQMNPERPWPFEYETVFQRKPRTWRSLSARVLRPGKPLDWRMD